MLNEIVFGEFTVQDLLIVFGILAAVVIVVQWLIKKLSAKKENEYVEPVTCMNCGWKGRVSSLAGRCPKCGQPLGARSAR